jgi:uncharacterized integral membrane protein (TIGR00697 family)
VFYSYCFNLSLPLEFFLLAEFFLCLGFIFLFYRFFQSSGLYVYSTLAVIIANLQVLRLGTLGLTGHPIALGTVIFTSTYFVSDILTELYGPKKAYRLIGLSFISMFFVPFFMLFTLLYPGPVQKSIDGAIQTLFNPSMRFFIASMISFGISQLLDIYVFQKLKSATGGRYLGLRSALSLTLSSFLDITLFSALAWVVFSPSPLPWTDLWSSYIIPSLLIRLVATLCFSPVLYVFRIYHDRKYLL